jgi:hypothetical protein
MVSMKESKEKTIDAIELVKRILIEYEGIIDYLAKK